MKLGVMYRTEAREQSVRGRTMWSIWVRFEGQRHAV